jgi:hypothetical protein
MPEQLVVFTDGVVGGSGDDERYHEANLESNG